MHPSNIVLIYEKPESYFFPLYSGIVFAPFGVPQPSFRYLLYKILHLLHLPCCSLFWGEWKSHVKTAEKVIIFDFGYQRGMERYIRRANPDCQVYLFFWNRVNRYNKKHLHFSDSDAIFSTDSADCKQYGLKYNHIFYPREFSAPYVSSVQDKLFFLGADKGRAPFIASLKPILQDSGLICDIRILSSVTDSDYRERFQDILTDKGLSYEEYLTQVKSCGVLLDVNQEGQSALTMRVMEAIYLSKKLITNNSLILACDFYNPNNIFVLPEEGLPTTEEIQSFLNMPFKPYPDHIVDSYSFEHWITQFA